jgi:uncharacterized protein
VVIAEFVFRRTDIERGLMHRPVVPDGTGMLFDMGHVAVHRFWMKDTQVPLDMVFISPAWVVAGIVHRTVPYDITLRGVDALSRYVLEVPGGWSTRNGVAPGQMVTVVRLPG